MHAGDTPSSRDRQTFASCKLFFKLNIPPQHIAIGSVKSLCFYIAYPVALGPSSEIFTIIVFIAFIKTSRLVINRNYFIENISTWRCFEYKMGLFA